MLLSLLPEISQYQLADFSVDIRRVSSFSLLLLALSLSLSLQCFRVKEARFALDVDVASMLFAHISGNRFRLTIGLFTCAVFA